MAELTVEMVTDFQKKKKEGGIQSPLKGAKVTATMTISK